MTHTGQQRFGGTTIAPDHDAVVRHRRRDTVRCADAARCGNRAAPNGGAISLAVCAAIVATACSGPAAERGGLAHAGGAAVGTGNGTALLAYEHTVGVQLDRAAIAPRLQAIRAACSDARFGACTLLEAQQSSGDRPQARTVMRMAPDAIEPMVALAAEDGETGERSTRAEDLAVAVRDNTTEQDRLTREMTRLQAFEARSDLSVADMIALPSASPPPRHSSKLRSAKVRGIASASTRSC